MCLETLNKLIGLGFLLGIKREVTTEDKDMTHSLNTLFLGLP